MTKLEKLARIEGTEIMEMLERATFDSVSPGICTNKNCDYVTEVEPDCVNGYCEICGTQTVSSAIVLAGII